MDEREFVWRVDYSTKSGWRPYFTAESAEAAKAYIAIWEGEDKPLKWFKLHGVEMARKRRTDGTYFTMRLLPSSLITMQEVKKIMARKAVKVS